MKNKHIPQRKCVACGEKHTKQNFMVVIKPPNKSPSCELHVSQGSLHKEGRGAYLCKNEQCLLKARKTRRFERTFSCKVSNEIYEKLETAVKCHE